jgi:hypothetical protein
MHIKPMSQPKAGLGRARRSREAIVHFGATVGGAIGSPARCI